MFGAAAGPGMVSIQFLVVGAVFSKGVVVDFALKLLLVRNNDAIRGLHEITKKLFVKNQIMIRKNKLILSNLTRAE